MCFKKWFSSPAPVPTYNTGKTALLFGINNYPGSSNDLRGCLNDIHDWEDRLNKDFPGFMIKKFEDSQATRSRFILEVSKSISVLKPKDILLVIYSGHGTQTIDKHDDELDGYDEALYLYDGTVIDDDIGAALKMIPEGATVLLMFDSCFSGTVTRDSADKKVKYVQNPDVPMSHNKNIRFPDELMTWMVFSGCGEQQTSADAYIDGRYNGAFTYFALKSLRPGMTYMEWFIEIRKHLPGNGFEQSPTFEGNEQLFNNFVFVT